MDGSAVVATVIGGVILAGAICWIVIDLAVHRARKGGRGGRG